MKKLVKKLLKSNATHQLLAFLVASYMRLVSITTRWNVRPEHVLEPVFQKHPNIILCLWHSHLLMTTAVWRKKYGRISVMVSHHKDGQFIADVCKRFDVGAVRGSSSKGAIGAFRNAWKLLAAGHSLAITPDGPRGPRHQAQAGAVALAKATGVPLIPIGSAFSWRHVFPSWDKFLMPYPFGRGHYVVEDPIFVSRDADEAEMQVMTDRLEHTLNIATAEAETAINIAQSQKRLSRAGIAYQVYRGATLIAGPIISGWLNYRAHKGKEDITRIGERLGRASVQRAGGSLIWVHAASVGESLSVLPLVEQILKYDSKLRVLLTTGTVTSAAIMQQRLPNGAIHQFVPVDQPDAVGRFLDHWEPDLALFVESELWPNLLLETKSRGCPLVLINARMSERSYAFWNRFGGLAQQLTGAFSLLLAQSEQDAERFRQLGGSAAENAGNLKYDALPLPADEKALAEMRKLLDGRSLWVAASTHPGEEEQIAEAHRIVHEKKRELLTIVVPRHAKRGNEIAQMLREKGYVVAQRSLNQSLTAKTQIYLADTMGELGLWYRLTDIVFMGGTLVPHGGQNPLEAARLQCALLLGPHMENFADITQSLEAEKGCARVSDAETLGRELHTLLEDNTKRESFSQAAEKVVQQQQSALDTILQKLEPLLSDLSSKEGGLLANVQNSVEQDKRASA